jgi:hypothetical protein
MRWLSRARCLAQDGVYSRDDLRRWRWAARPHSSAGHRGLNTVTWHPRRQVLGKSACRARPITATPWLPRDSARGALTESLQGSPAQSATKRLIPIMLTGHLSRRCRPPHSDGCTLARRWIGLSARTSSSVPKRPSATRAIALGSLVDRASVPAGRHPCLSMVNTG